MSTTTLRPRSRTVTLAEREVLIERPSGRKVSRALALLKALNAEAKGLAGAWQRAEIQFERENYDELDRAQARMEYPPRVMLDAETRAPLREPDTLLNPAYVEGGAEPERIPNPNAGEFVVAPSPIDRITDAEWEASGGVLKVPRRAKPQDLIPVVFGDALDAGEDNVVRLLALFAMSNEDVTTAWRQGGDKFNEVLAQAGDDLLDTAYGDELLELAVVCGEVVDDTFVRKARDLGERLGNAARLLGLGKRKKEQDTPQAQEATQTTPEQGQTASQTTSPTAPTSTSSPDGSTPSSSSELGAPSDGPSTPSSTPPMTSPSSSEPDSTPSGSASASSSASASTAMAEEA